MLSRFDTLPRRIPERDGRGRTALIAISIPRVSRRAIKIAIVDHYLALGLSWKC